MLWHERLAGWIRAESRSVPELAKAAGIKKDTVYKWLQGKVKRPQRDADLDLFLAVLNKTRVDLFFDAAAMGVTYTKEIPLLLLKQMKPLAPGQSLRDAWDGQSVAQVPSTVSPEAVAIRLDNDDGILGDPRGDTEFLSGDVVIVEVDKPLVPGSYVFVIAEKIRAVLFGNYRPDDIEKTGNFSIRVPNPDYPDVHISDANPGFVIGRATKLIRDL